MKKKVWPCKHIKLVKDSTPARFMLKYSFFRLCRATTTKMFQTHGNVAQSAEQKDQNKESEVM